MKSKDSPEAGTILVVDDDDVITGLIQTVLTKDGYQVYLANNGVDGVKMAEEVNPDLIFMDIAMPGLDGYEATEQIKNNPALKDTPVIFLTGKKPSEDGGKAFAMGGITYMVKPFTNQQLKDLVRLSMESIQANRFKVK